MHVSSQYQTYNYNPVLNPKNEEPEIVDLKIKEIRDAGYYINRGANMSLVGKLMHDSKIFLGYLGLATTSAGLIIDLWGNGMVAKGGRIMMNYQNNK